MKKYITIIIVLLSSSLIKAQQLNVPLTIQEQDQWCWAGCTTCMLNYYGYPVTQCQVAEYARSVITWTSFGTTNCCVDPSQGCNQPNYNWGQYGSIDDILLHFGNINCSHATSPLPLATIQNNVAHNHLMVYHWSWYAGGGHFVVGTGVNGNNTYYMNPWFGEGYKMSTYNDLVDDGQHYYNSTNIVMSPTAVSNISLPVGNEMVYPNPSTGGIYVRNANSVKVYNTLGALVYNAQTEASDRGAYIDLSGLAKGIYYLSANEGSNREYTKFVLQ
jgi:hypothetical protein